MTKKKTGAAKAQEVAAAEEKPLTEKEIETLWGEFFDGLRSMLSGSVS
jgi:hypothetical protein